MRWRYLPILLLFAVARVPAQGLPDLGDVAQLHWLSPIGLVHVLALGTLTYLASLLYLRVKHT